MGSPFLRAGVGPVVNSLVACHDGGVVESQRSIRMDDISSRELLERCGGSARGLRTNIFAY